MGEEYNGWTNRETWAVNLWVTNDQGLMGAVDEAMKGAYDAEGENYRLDEVYRDVMFDLLDGDGLPSRETWMMKDDIGSLWRVNWRELADTWVKDNA
jgi:hypothetical protein